MGTFSVDTMSANCGYDIFDPSFQYFAIVSDVGLNPEKGNYEVFNPNTEEVSVSALPQYCMAACNSSRDSNSSLTEALTHRKLALALDMLLSLVAVGLVGSGGFGEANLGEEAVVGGLAAAGLTVDLRFFLKWVRFGLCCDEAVEEGDEYFRGDEWNPNRLAEPPPPAGLAVVVGSREVIGDEFLLAEGATTPTTALGMSA